MSVLLAATALIATLLVTQAPAAADFRNNANVSDELHITVAGIDRPIEIERDRHAVPTIRGERFLDVIFGHGFVHARDRFFQMDGARRLAAGEVAALAGPRVLALDQAARKHRFRDVAQQVIAHLDDFEREIIEHYTAGVNAALAQFEARPFEYDLLQVDPEPWKPEDTALVMLGMFAMLQDIEGSTERRVGVMHDALPKALAKFLTPQTSRFDALLLPKVLEDGELVNDWQPMPIPGPDVIDLREQSLLTIPDGLVESTPLALGSNNWAVDGSRTRDGRAILANDPHLHYMVPGVWHRAVLEWDDGLAAGLSLPGTPGITFGANKQVAWGFTNYMGDAQDYIIIEVHPDDPSLYLTPDGYEPFGEITEEIKVRGRGPERITLRTTRWGVITETDANGRPLVLKWPALDPEMVNFEILRMMLAESVDDAVEVARSWYGPAQNILMADADGRIAWVVSGYLPRRVGFDGMKPVAWACGTIGWDGQIDESDRPMVIDPPEGMLFTANNRTMPIEQARRLGGIWTAGTRAERIGEMLNADQPLTEADLFEMQHDTRVALFDHYLNALLDAADRRPVDDELSHRGLAIVRDWNGRADGDQPAMALLDAFRRQLETRIIGALVRPCRELDGRFTYRWFMSDEVLLRLLEERPAHLLPPGHDDWDALLLDVWRAVLSAIEAQNDTRPNGIETEWAKVNRLQMTHPLSAVMPFLAERLDMADAPQFGHRHAVRVATPQFGASARLVVSPGRWDDAILQTPAGQSGDPNSPNYRDLHRAWLTGESTPLLPGKPVNRIELVPGE